ncbi:nuclear transport factor 2 family protein [Actinoallomurus purpureus]|uniref:nuclear transport factor 2 family protein n=1 Tax=Actinoallomurus purpureus TaxID=478114 RepID=UPI0020921332|nr:nuclear transport factor 2 family protein [Actinoallomurus purpureus]MCO6004066.1 nuclear transport factor 2 family protein [Actinoallomurus purpureus]
MDDQSLRDRFEIIEICTRMAWHLDHCDWEPLLELFTDDVSLDYSSLNGGEPQIVSRKDMVEKWRGNREGLTATQHLVSNQLVSVDGNTGTATAMFQATHLLPNPYGAPTWTLGGEYRYGLIRTEGGWRINALAMTIIWADGNRNIRDLATQGS